MGMIGILDSENIHKLTPDLMVGLRYLIICLNQDRVDFKIDTTCLKPNVSISFVRCKGSEKDNMDKHIISLIGYYAGKKGKPVVRVLSNDKGFKNIIKFWKGTGLNIDQLGS